MTPIQEFRWCLSIIRKIFKLVSQDIFQANHRHGLIFYTINLLLVFAIWCYAATANDEQFDLSIRFNCIAGLIGTIQVLMKYHFLRDLQHLLPTIEFFADIYEKNSQPTSQYYGICQKFARISKLVIKVGLPLYVGSLILGTIVGSIELIVTGAYKPILIIYFPGIYDYSTEMMALSFIYNYTMVVIDLLILIPSDMFFFLLFANMRMVPAVIKAHLDELTKLLEQKQNSVDAMEIKRRFAQLIGMQRRYNDNVSLLDKHISKFCILNFITANGYSIIGIFVIVKVNLPMAYGMVAAGVFQITAFCVLGTIVVNSSDRVYDAIYEFEWYKLPHNEQKNYLLLLHYAQQPQQLYVAGINPLNMETCVSTLKGIYSYAMVLNSTVE